MTRAALALALVLAGCGAPAAKPDSPNEAKRRAPEVVSAGRLAEILGHERGQVLLVNVFASWCTPCKEELPDLARLAREHPKMHLLGIDVDEESAPEESVRAILDAVPRAMTVVRQPQGIAPLLPALKLPADWHAQVPPGWERAIPLTFVYDGQGAFQTGSVGQLLPEALAAIGEIAGK